MAKRKAPGKARGAGRKTKATKQTRKQAEKVLRDGPIRKRAPKKILKEQALPGMEDRKDRVLLKLAGGVADERNTQAESKATEQGYLQSAQKRMQQTGATVFSGHGVEFIRVPGEEKFRCRLTKTGDQSEGDEETGEAEPADTTAMDAVPSDGTDAGEEAEA